MSNIPNVNNKKNLRVQIIDVSHLFYKFAYGGGPDLSTTLLIDGVPTLVKTKVPTLVIKAIHRWSKGGIYPTVVCFDSLGSNKSRKAYFKQGNMTGTTGEVYKGSRTSQGSMFYDDINLTKNLLAQGGVGILMAEKYEADDLKGRIPDQNGRKKQWCLHLPAPPGSSPCPGHSHDGQESRQSLL